MYKLILVTWSELSGDLKVTGFQMDSLSSYFISFFAAVGDIDPLQAN